MVTVVYIDVLFAVNLIVTYFILLAASRVLRRKDGRLRLFLGAVLGAVYSLFIFFPQVGFLYSSLLKVVLSLIIVAIAFRFSTLRNFLRLVIVFYLISFLFGGLIFAVYLFFSPPGLLVRNGVLYLDISPVVLILSAAACYIVVVLVTRLLARAKKESALYDVTLEADGKTAGFRGFLDTGNSLTDLITGVPVIISEYRAVENLIPPEMKEIYRNGKTKDAALLSEGKWAERFRMIPFGTVGNDGGLLPAFRPDRLFLRSAKGKTVETEAIIAVSGKKLSTDGQYAALLNPLLFGRGGPPP